MPAAGEAMGGEKRQGFGLAGARFQPQQAEPLGQRRLLEPLHQLPAEAQPPGAGRDKDSLHLGIAFALAVAQHDGTASQALAIDPADEELHIRPRQGLDIDEVIALRRIQPVHIGIELGHQLAYFRPPGIGRLDDDQSLAHSDTAAFKPSKTASSAVRGASASPTRWKSMPRSASVAPSPFSGSPG